MSLDYANSSVLFACCCWPDDGILRCSWTSGVPWPIPWGGGVQSLLGLGDVGYGCQGAPTHCLAVNMVKLILSPLGLQPYRDQSSASEDPQVPANPGTHDDLLRSGNASRIPFLISVTAGIQSGRFHHGPTQVRRNVSQSLEFGSPP